MMKLGYNVSHAVCSGCAVAFLIAGGSSLAAEADVSQAEPQTLKKIRVEDSVGEEARQKSDVQKLTVNAEDVQRYGDATVGDVLRRLPGMTFTGPAGVTKDIRMRGLDKGYTQILINGEIVPGAVQERQMQVDRLPADMIERIEIIRNPSARYDASGIGGTINIVLKHTADDLTRLRGSYGRNGDLDVGDGVAQWSHAWQDVDLVLALSHTVGAEDVIEDKQTLNVSGAVTQREYKPKPVKKSETLFSPNLTWRFGTDRLVIEPFVSLGTEDKRERSQVTNTAGAVTKSTSNAEDKDDRIGRFAARYESTVEWGNWNAKVGVQQGKSEKDKYATEANGVNVITKRTQELEEIVDDQAYTGVGIALPFDTHALSVGLEWRMAEYDKRKFKAEASNATNPLVAAVLGRNDNYNVQEQRYIAYAEDQWHVAQAHWLTAGLRYEYTQRDAEDAIGNGRSSHDDSPNPSLHYRWELTPKLNFRASAAQTLRLAKFDDINPQIETKAGTLTDPDKTGNPDLQAEHATGIEVGFERYLWDSRAVIGINFYDRDVKDFIEKQTRLENTRYVQRPYNVGDAHFWGAELDWRLPFAKVGANFLTLWGSHSEMRGSIAASNGVHRDVKDMSPRVSNLGLDWTQQAWRLSVGMAANYTPGYTTDSVNDDNLREIKRRNAATTLDAYIAEVFSPLFELRLTGKNLLSIDKDEATAKYTAAGVFNAAEQKVERSEPTVYLSVESRF